VLQSGLMKAIVKGIFAAHETFSYHPRGALFGQLKEESCAAAVCRMLLQDDNIEIPEAYLRIVLQTDEQGTLLTNIAPTLKQMGIKKLYELRNLETVAELREKVTRNPAIVVVKVNEGGDFHTVIVDKISDEFLSIRDPLPAGTGAAYKIRIEDFLPTWIQKTLGKGFAIVVK
jgi:ABC-type bacteriocin/lantibiotic exporter with double-glycine peptidase domain